MRKIVFNAQICRNDEEMLSVPLKARAVLAYIGASFSDGTECTEDLCKKLIASVDFSRYNPPLLLDHVWLTEAIKGKMTSIELANNELVSVFEITDRETAEKVQAGEWQSISLTFSEENGEFQIEECSIVAIPAIKGAKIVADNAAIENAVREDKAAEELPDIDDDPEEVSEPKLELSAEVPEDTEELVEKTAENAEKTCKNAEFERILCENAKMKKELADLHRQIAEEKISRTVQEQVKSFVSNRLTPPSVQDDEAEFLSAIAAIDLDLVNKYAKIKYNCGNCNSFGGPRISIPEKAPTNKTAEFLDYANKYDEERTKKGLW